MSAEEWNAAADLNDPADEATLGALVPEEALASVTVGWRGQAAYLASDGQVCAFLADGRGQGPVTCEDPEAGVHLLGDRIGWPSLLFGVMPEGATDIVATRGGADVTAVPEGIDVPQSIFLGPAVDGGPTVYAVTLGLLPDTLAFLDAAGQTLETVPLDIEPDL